MIKNIFQDLDECILCTIVNEVPNEWSEYVEFKLPDDRHTYRTYIRPCAKALFEYYNSVVGKDNVYILTTATSDYAKTLNDMGGFGLDETHIITREDIQNHRVSTAYEGKVTIPHKLHNHNNVLIDNLSYRDNDSKVDMMGIKPERYFQTSYYNGINTDDCDFFESIKGFIESFK
jgi:hypothetical protein